ncbi:MAG: DUF5317 domain-containing protein [Peptococcaceae bacterium]|nr:DUF5317 domain-containing protein [Peptococcaceae bacterium]
MLVALARGGKWQNLKTFRLRQTWLVFMAVGLQILIFNPVWDKHVAGFSINNFIYVLSILLLITFLFININIFGFRILGLGIISNATAIIANGGYMPSSLESLKKVLPAEKINLLVSGSASYNVVLISEQTRFKFLCDIFYFPHINVYSIGDILIAAGAFLTVQQMMLMHK